MYLLVSHHASVQKFNSSLQDFAAKFWGLKKIILQSARHSACEQSLLKRLCLQGARHYKTVITLFAGELVSL